ncbi:aldo/keto reductase [Paenibacillus rhizoplanae]
MDREPTKKPHSSCLIIFEAGGNFLDTANNYAIWNEGCVGGESESLLGEWMKERKKQTSDHFWPPKWERNRHCRKTEKNGKA